MRIACACFFALVLIGAVPSDNANFAALKFRNIGPLNGRIDAVSGVPGDPSTYYAGGLGGLFKTSDAGVTWKSAFNNEPVSSVNAIAVAPSVPTTVYIGTGESNLRNDVLFGDGVWRSTDSGNSWTHNGLDAVGSIAQIAVDPQNAQRVFVAALGDVYGASADRGIYRTLDGGTTWTKVLYTDDRTGGSSIAIDPSNAQHLLAGMWEGWRTPYHLTSGGANDGVYESKDGGEHWTRLQSHGLPDGVTGRIAIAFAPSDPERVYALIESAQGTLWRSNDGGASWTMVNAGHGIDQRPFYFTSLTVDPKNPDTVYFMSVQMWRTTDGGKSAAPMRGTRGGDYHQLWIDPQIPRGWRRPTIKALKSRTAKAKRGSMRRWRLRKSITSIRTIAFRTRFAGKIRTPVVRAGRATASRSAASRLTRFLARAAARAAGSSSTKQIRI